MTLPPSGTTSLQSPELVQILHELVEAAREGTREDSPDWKFRPAWRQRLWTAVRAYDAATGHAPQDASRGASRGALTVAPKPRPVTIASNLAAEFDRFWSHYPKKSEGGRLLAEKAYSAARKIASAEEIMTGLLTYPFREDPNYQKTAPRWLSEGCWMHEQDTRPATVVKERNGRRHEAAELAEEIGMDLMTPISEQFPETRDGKLTARPADYAVAD